MQHHCGGFIAAQWTASIALPFLPFGYLWITETNSFKLMISGATTALLTVLLSGLAARASAFHVEHRVSCSRRKICNGNLMCAWICEPGTSETDPWTDKSLEYQRILQRDDLLSIVDFPATHNSAISEAYGYGIEKYFISALGGGLDTNQGDDVGTGVCQHLSIVDQLNMGIRHVEVDIWWGPKQDPEGNVHDGSGDLVVCHSPVPLYPVGEINREAEAAGLDLVWDPKNMSCIGTKRMFVEVLTEIRDWMMLAENLEELIIIYFDTKIFVPRQQYIDQGNADILSVFGREMLFTPEDGDPLMQTVSSLLSQGKRLIIENNQEAWLHPSDEKALVFYPTLWKHQFNLDDLEEFPACTVEGDSEWYGSTMVRALSSAGVTEAGTRCGVNLVSSDYTNPDDMKMFVWSWDQQEPKINTADSANSSASADHCVAMLPSSRWAAMDCATELPYACETVAEPGSPTNASAARSSWSVDVSVAGPWTEKAPCPDGFVFGVPRNGFTNAILNTASFGQTIWLNTPLSFS